MAAKAEGPRDPQHAHDPEDFGSDPHSRKGSSLGRTSPNRWLAHQELEDREGVTLRASLSVRLKRWLELHPSERNCTYSRWVPNAKDHSVF